MPESDSEYNYFCDLVVRLQDDGKSPADFMIIGARLIEHAYAGADNKDAAAKTLAAILQQIRKNTGTTAQ